MEQRIETALMDHAFGPDAFLKSRMTGLAESNKELLKDIPAAQKVNIPTAEGLETIGRYMQSYKRDNPNASRREIRKAAQQKFNVKIFRQPYKREINGKA